MEQGYPNYLLYSLIILSVSLIIFKPKYMFWFGLFYFAAREFQKSVFTRIADFGPYLNLDDLIILFLLVALLRYKSVNKFKVPFILACIFISIFLSIIIISITNSLTYEVQRAHKAALYFPIAIFIAYNFITQNENYSIFLKILFIGSIIASIQYLIYILSRQSEILIYTDIGIIRSVGFLSFVPILVITSFFFNPKGLEKKELLLYLLGLALFWLNILFSQTRSVIISIIITIFVLMLFFKLRIKFRRTFYLTLIAIIIYFAITSLFPAFDIEELLFGRLILLREQGMADTTTYGRFSAILVEWKYFLQSNIILGNGLGYHYFVTENNLFISWGHIGHVSYLATLGLFGFVIYTLLIPIKSIRNYISLSKITNQENYFIVFLMVAISVTINDWIQFWLSASYLGQGAFLAGITYGTLWKSYKLKRIKS